MNRYEVMLSKLSEILKEERKKRGLSQAEFGELCNKPQALIAKFEKGMQPNAAFRIIYEISGALGMEVSQWTKKAEILADKALAEERQSRKLAGIMGSDMRNFGAYIEKASPDQIKKLREMVDEIKGASQDLG